MFRGEQPWARLPTGNARSPSLWTNTSSWIRFCKYIYWGVRSFLKKARAASLELRKIALSGLMLSQISLHLYMEQPVKEPATSASSKN